MPTINTTTEVKLSEADLREAISDWLTSRAQFDLYVTPAEAGSGWTRTSRLTASPGSFSTAYRNDPLARWAGWEWMERITG